MQYLVHHPLMGYIERPLHNGHNVFSNKRYRSAQMSNYPDCFVLYYQSPWLGGRAIAKVIRNAVNEGYRVGSLGHIRSGGYQGEFVEIRRAGASCAALSPIGTVNLD